MSKRLFDDTVSRQSKLFAFSTIACLVIAAILMASAVRPIAAAPSATLWSEDFETDGSGTRYTPSEECTDGSADFFTRTDGSTIGSFVTYNSPSNDFFWAAMDTNGDPCTLDSEFIEFEAFNMNGNTSFEFKGLFAEDDSSDGNEDWDDNSSVHVEYQVDGGAWTELVRFESTADGSNSEAAEDTNFDGTGDGAALTADFAEFSELFSATGTMMAVRVRVEILDSGDEDIAFDNLTVTDAAPATADPLLITEVVVTPTEGEMVEIHNPGGAAVDLSNVYLTDATFANGGAFYYNIVTGADAGGGGFGDFHARFPDGAMIGGGEYQTIALNGSDAFSNTFGTMPTYELYEDGAAADSVPDMREALAGSINDQGGLSNSGEVVVLYSWDGASDLVQDHDYFIWGDVAEAIDKSGIMTDGPDGDVVASAYLSDTATADQDTFASSHSDGETFQREDLTEGAEVAAGGNGITGQDETSEDLNNTWCVATTPTPNAASDCPVIVAGPDSVMIYDIQGMTETTPLDGDFVTTVGVVTADYQAGGFDGFVIQDATGDGNDATSDGIFVYTGNTPVSVTVGTSVAVTGTAGEAFGVTQLSNVTVGAAPAAPTRAAVPPTKIVLPVASVDMLEQYEGMVVEFDQTLYVTEHFNLGRFGELLLSAEDRLYQFTHTSAPDEAGYTAHLDTVARSSILLDDGRSSQNDDPTLYPMGGLSAANTIRGGDTVANLIGVMHYGFGAYRVEPITEDYPAFTSANPRPTDLTTPAGEIAVAALNALNYFTTLDDAGPACGPDGTADCRGADSADELTRQTDKLLKALIGMDADVIGLMEVENLNSSVAAADDPVLVSLVDGMNAVAGAGTFDFIKTGTIGTDAIRGALIYNTTTISVTGDFAILDSSVDPDFNDGKNRPALAQTFTEKDSGEAFTVVVNHLKSKGSDCSDTGIVGDDDTTTGQGNCNGTRTAAANALASWLTTDPTDSADTDIMIIGDLNSYRMEDPITALKSNGYSDFAADFARGADQPYSYVFSGQWGYLDYAMGSDTMKAQVTSVVEWHINADEPRSLDYNTEFNAPGFYADDIYRVSDHDPIVVRLNLGTELAVSLANNATPTAATPLVLVVIMLASLGCVSLYVLRKRA